jgi:predicted AAA+ superfamily ATPase
VNQLSKFALKLLKGGFMSALNRDVQGLIEKWLFKGKVIIIYGARQVGKTTISRQILDKFGQNRKVEYIDCEQSSARKAFESTDIAPLSAAIGDKELIVLDEAQNINDIGRTLKVIHDHFPAVQIIATGSSSFDLANKLSEPMTGRVISFIVYPFSIKEISSNTSFIEASSKLENILINGAYPDIYNKPIKEGQELLNLLAGNYLYKDILAFERLKSSNQLLEILQLLALQIGSEVSYHEIGQKLGLNHITVGKYIDLLEKCFIVFKLRSLSKNKRKEISKSVKVYFYDLGIRNSLIQSFAPLSLRTDVGALWENFCIVERKKINQAKEKTVNQYFHRTYNGQEVDYIEEYDDKFEGYEFKYSVKKAKPPQSFLEEYKNASFKVINKDNWSEFLL